MRHFAILFFVAVTALANAIESRVSQGRREFVEEKDGKVRTWSITALPARDQKSAEFSVSYHESARPNFKTTAHRVTGVRAMDYKKFTETLAKFSEWAEKARKENAPAVAKELPSIYGTGWRFTWNGFYAILEGPEGDFFSEEDSRYLRLLFLSAQEMVAEALKVQDAAAEFAAKLK